MRGTKPANHADMLSFEEPVLPATGRSSSRAGTPDPSWTTLLMAYVAAAMTSSSNTCSPVLSPWYFN